MWVKFIYDESDLLAGEWFSRLRSVLVSSTVKLLNKICPKAGLKRTKAPAEFIEKTLFSAWTCGTGENLIAPPIPFPIADKPLNEWVASCQIDPQTAPYTYTPPDGPEIKMDIQGDAVTEDEDSEEEDDIFLDYQPPAPHTVSELLVNDQTRHEDKMVEDVRNNVPAVWPYLFH
jgi:hypothetical protein